jgi:pimeloyl-ACP methyl ester carboxylesterase
MIDGLEAQGISRDDLALAWRFKAASRPQMAFNPDPANPVIPFPNNLLLGADGKVAFPTDAGTPEQIRLYTGLNTLDGFSTTAPIVSVFNPSNATASPVLNQGKIADSSLDGGTTGFLPLPSDAGIPYPRTAPDITTCLDCVPNPLLDGGTPANYPQQLQFVPNRPLDERSNYGVFVTTDLQDTNGKNVMPASAFALLRSSNPLFANGKSTVDLISDDQAQLLEPGRARLKPFLDALVAQGIPRSKIALAWGFTTQSEVSTLDQLHGLPTLLGLQPGLLSANPVFASQTSSPDVWVGEIRVPQILNGPEGTLSPTNPTIKKIWFILALPSGAAPTNGYPVTIFGHGLTRSRLDSQAISSLSPIVGLTAQGQAVIAIDVVWHGDRSFCVGSGQYLASLGLTASDDFACVDPVNPAVVGKCDSTTSNPTYGRCIAKDPATRKPCDSPGSTGELPGDLYCNTQGQGLCLEDLKCEGGDFRRTPASSDPAQTPIISGWNILNLNNLFATRDNFRQQVVDLTQLYRVISATGPNSLNGLLVSRGLDPTNVNYVGQSLGGILGTLYTSVAPEIHHAVLNVPGGDFTDILLNSPSFAPAKTGFLATLASQTPPITPGTPAFATFISIAKWILDPADPRNAAYAVMNGTSAPSNRDALIQYITRDQTIPNSATEKLIGDARRLPNAIKCFKFDPSDDPNAAPPGGLAPPNRHGFLLNNVNGTITGVAQNQAATFISAGTVIPAPGGGNCP